MRTLLVLAALLIACRGAPSDSPPAPAEPPPVKAGPLPREVPYVATPHPVVAEMLDLAQVKPTDVVYDLGSGDGRIVIAAAKRGAKAVGIDIDPVLVEAATEAARREALSSKTEFRVGDLFQADFGEATVVTMYLMHSVNVKLRPRLLTQLRPGTRIVSHTFDLGEWRPDQQLLDAVRQIYFWVVPANASGTWEWVEGGTPMRLRLEQEFQRVRGTLKAGDVENPVRTARLVGERLSFVADTVLDGKPVAAVFNAAVSGERIEGTVAPDATPQHARPWKATRLAGTVVPLGR
jgi:SAM-dependent methyltransferase